MPNFFIMYDGHSVDGLGDPKYHSHTLNAKTAREFIESHQGEGAYWTGKVEIFAEPGCFQVKDLITFDTTLKAIDTTLKAIALYQPESKSKVIQYLEDLQQLSKAYGLDVVAYIDPQASEPQAALGISLEDDNNLSNFDDALSLVSPEFLDTQYKDWTGDS